MFTVKATYRNQTRKLTFPDQHSFFPSYDQLYNQLYRVFPISHSYYLSKLLFSPIPNSPDSRILLSMEVHNAEEYERCIRTVNGRSWPGALLRFSVYDETPHKSPTGSGSTISARGDLQSSYTHDNIWLTGPEESANEVPSILIHSPPAPVRSFAPSGRWSQMPMDVDSSIDHRLGTNMFLSPMTSPNFASDTFVSSAPQSGTSPRPQHVQAQHKEGVHDASPLYSRRVVPDTPKRSTPPLLVAGTSSQPDPVPVVKDLFTTFVKDFERIMSDNFGDRWPGRQQQTSPFNAGVSSPLGSHSAGAGAGAGTFPPPLFGMENNLQTSYIPPPPVFQTQGASESIGLGAGFGLNLPMPGSFINVPPPPPILPLASPPHIARPASPPRPLASYLRPGSDAQRARDVACPVQEPELPRSTTASAPVIHQNVVCDSCGLTIEGVRHKCLDCPDYDLCTGCIQSGCAELHNPFHEFFDIKEPGRVIVHTVFSGQGERAASTDNRRSPAPARSSSGTREYGLPHEHRALCDLCDSTIRGDRYKCLNCPDFDTCEQCFAITSQQHPTHGFVRIKDSQDLITRRVWASPEKHHASCNVCKKVILGVRYKCMHPLCPDFDLCSACESQPIPLHPSAHPMLKMRMVETVIPTVFRVGGTRLIESQEGQRRLEERETSLNERERDVTAAEADLQSISESLNLKRTALEQKEASLQEGQTLLHEQEMILEEAEMNLKAKERSLDEKELDLEATKVCLADLERNLEATARSYEAPEVPDLPPRLLSPAANVSNGLQPVSMHAYGTSLPDIRVEPPSPYMLTLGRPPSHPINFTPAHWTSTADVEVPRERVGVAVATRSSPSPPVSAQNKGPMDEEDRDTLTEVLHEYIADRHTSASSSVGLTTPSLMSSAPRLPSDLGTGDLYRELWPDVASELRHLLPAFGHGSPRAENVVMQGQGEWEERAFPRPTASDSTATIVAAEVQNNAHVAVNSPLLGTEPLLARPTESRPPSDTLSRLANSLAALLSAHSQASVPPSTVNDNAVNSSALTSVHEAEHDDEVSMRGQSEAIESALHATCMSDNNIPDGQIFPPGAEFVKSWNVVNDGTREWPETTELLFVAGHRLGSDEAGVEKFKVGKVAAGQIVDVWTGELKAPEHPGKYVSYWRLSDGQGNQFGHSMWIDITVAESADNSSGSESLAASSVIMPHSAASQTAVPTQAAPTVAAASSITMPSTPTDDTVSGEGSDGSSVMLISAPSSDDDSSSEWEDTRSYVTPPALPRVGEMEYVVLYESSSDGDQD